MIFCIDNLKTITLQLNGVTLKGGHFFTKYLNKYSNILYHNYLNNQMGLTYAKLQYQMKLSCNINNSMNIKQYAIFTNFKDQK